MSVFYFSHDTHTFASLLRGELEAEARPGEFTSCVIYHPLDRHVEVTARSADTVRSALLRAKQKIGLARREVLAKASAVSSAGSTAYGAAPRARSAAPAGSTGESARFRAARVRS